MDGDLNQLGRLGCRNNPLDQDLILKLILEHVGRANVDDLLACRLVKHSWNRVAIQVLEHRHGYALELSYKKLLKFKYLLWRTKLSKVVALAEHQELESLRLSLRFNVFEEEKFDFDSASEADDDIECNATEAAEVSQLLIANPWLRVAFVTCLVRTTHDAECGTEAELTNHVLFNLLQLTSKDLTSFELYAHDASEHDFEEVNWLAFQAHFLEIQFPRLTSVHYGLTFRSDYDSLEDLSSHVSYIIKGAPKLAKLSLEIRQITNDGRYKPVPDNCLRDLILECSANIQELVIRFDEKSGKSVLEGLSEMKLPKLTSLSLKIVESGKLNPIKEFNQFLEHHCPALTRFDINFVWSVDEGEDLNLKFPVLPNILHFGFFPNYADTPNHMQALFETFTQMTTKFPSLHSMSLDFGVMLMLGARLERSGRHLLLINEYPAFLTVYTLKVVIPFCLDNYRLLDVWYTALIYRRAFPNLANLVIKPKMKAIRDASKSELKRVIKFLCTETKYLLKSLEVQNYARAWLQKKTEGTDLIFTRLSGLKTLKLFPPKKSKNKCEYAELNHSELIAHLHSLQVFQFGNKWVGETEICGIRDALKTLEWLKLPVSNFKKSGFSA